MSYQPTNWQANDIITAEKMNKLEQGISTNEPLILTATNSSGRCTLNASYNDLIAAYAQGRSIVAINETENDTEYSSCVGINTNYTYGFHFISGSVSTPFHASSATEALYTELLM